MATRADEIRKFLERGSASYFEAVGAVREFQKEILKQSTAALASRLPEVKRILGLKGLNPEDIKNHTLLEEDYADLCARLDLDSDHVLFAGLEWRLEADTRKAHPWAFADLWIRESDKYWAKLPHRCHGYLQRYGNEIYLEDRCLPEEIGKLRAKLERMLDRWCDIWRKTGGITASRKKA